MVTKRLLNNLFWVAFVLLATTGNVFALQYKIANSCYVNSNQVRDTFTVDATGVYNIWVPTYTSSYPVNATSFPEILKSDFPYKYSFKSDLSDSQIAAPFFPKLRGKFWHAWTRLDTITLTASVRCTLTFLADASIDSSDLPAKVFITKTDYCPLDTLMGNSCDIWIEAEDANVHNFTADTTTYSNAYAPNGIQNDQTKFGIGGGKVLRLNANDQSSDSGFYYAVYNFNVTDSGNYDIWYHGYEPNGVGWWGAQYHSPFTWQIDGGSAYQWDPNHTMEIREGRPDINMHQSYGWYRLTLSYYQNIDVPLDTGSHTLRIKVADTIALGIVPHVYEQMLDAFYLIKNDYNHDSTYIGKIPCDITASSNYLARLGGMDETSVLYPFEDTVKIALDRRLVKADTADTFQVKYKVINYYGEADSSAGYLYFQSGDITSSITISPSWYATAGHYHVIAEFYHGQDTIAYLDTYFGVIYETRFPGPREESFFGAAQDAVLYKHLKKAGVKWVRSYKADWTTIQPDSSDQEYYDWTAMDREIGKLKENNMNILCCAQHSSKFASTAPPSDWENYPFYPPDTTKWKDFIQTLVDRYEDDVKCWELWNEPWPNGYAWKGDFEDYAGLVAATHNAVNSADTSALLGAYFSPGLVYGQYDTSFDAGVFHIYTQDAPEGGLLLWLKSPDGPLNDIVPPAFNTPQKQAWCTEQVNGLSMNYNDPQRFANWLVRVYTLSMANNVDHYFYFDFDNWCLGEAGGGSGLINSDATPRPAYIAHSIMSYLMEGTEFDTTIDIGTRRWAYVFENTADTLGNYPRAIAVAWNTNGMIDSVSLKDPAGFTAINVMGDTIGIFNGDSCYFSLSSSPVYMLANSIAGLDSALEHLNIISSETTATKYDIVFYGGSNGRIRPDSEDDPSMTVTYDLSDSNKGTARVGDEDMPTFTITPDSGYAIDTITTVSGDTSLDASDYANHLTFKEFNEDSNKITYTWTFRPVVKNDSIKTTFTSGHVIKASVNGNGMIEPEYQVVADGRNSRIIYIRPDLGYTLNYLTDNVVDSCFNFSYQVNNVTEPHELIAYFSKIYFHVWANVDTSGHGTVSPNYKQCYWIDGDTAVITITPDSGYCIASITDYGIQMPISNPYVVKNSAQSPGQNHNIVVTFKPEYTVTVKAKDDDGHVSVDNITFVDSASTKVGYGENLIVYFSSNSNYVPESLTVDGSTTRYDYNEKGLWYITEDHNLEISFKPGAFVLTGVDGEHGTISPGFHTVNWGWNDTLTITPDAGYCIESISDNSTYMPVTNPYVLYNVILSHNVFVKFKAGYNVTASVSGDHGTVTPVYQAVDAGDSAVVTITPAKGYEIESITDNDTLRTVTSSYVISNVNQDHNVVVTFTPLLNLVSASVSGGDGTVSPDTQSVYTGSTYEINIYPDSGYCIASITDNDSSIAIYDPTAGSYGISNIDTAHTVVVVFRPFHLVSASVSGGHGTVSPDTQSVPEGWSYEINIYPDSGYCIESIVDNDSSIAIYDPSAGSYGISNIDTAHTVVVTFRPFRLVSASVSGGHGSVSPDTMSVPNGATCEVNIYPDSGYCIGSITDNDSSIAIYDNFTGSYGIFNIDTAHTVEVTFIPCYTVNASVSGGNGTLSPTTHKVPDGYTACGITMVPDSGYVVQSITDNGSPVEVPGNNVYQIYNVHEDHTVVVTFGQE